MTTFQQKLNFKQQFDLLQTCVREDLDLDSELKNHGVDYDALRYRHENHKSGFRLIDVEEPTAGHEVVANRPSVDNQIPVISFFSGAGGMDLGFEAAGFHHLASVEINETFCETLRKNRSQWATLGPPLHTGDISNRDEYSHLFRNKLGIKRPFEGVFHGGPPCQSFSIAANQRFAKSGDNFKRIGFAHENYGNLLFDYIWYIQQFLPRVFVIENVAGLQQVDGGKQLARALASLRECGYSISGPSVLNAADYGVPQNRRRLFVFGSRTSREVVIPRNDFTMAPCVSALRDSLEGVENHITREHRAESILRYMELHYGGRDQLGRVDRLDPALPSKTVIAGGAKGGGRSHLHPYIPRTLSARECARLQTFPDNYVFCGTPARQFTQVGNAVPPLLAMRLSEAIYQSVYA